jgi:hypothetical protein
MTKELLITYCPENPEYFGERNYNVPNPHEIQYYNHSGIVKCIGENLKKLESEIGRIFDNLPTGTYSETDLIETIIKEKMKYKPPINILEFIRTFVHTTNYDLIIVLEFIHERMREHHMPYVKISYE